MFQWFQSRFEAYVNRQFAERAHRAGQAAVAVARNLAPVDTGLLRSRIYYTVIEEERLLTLHCDVHYAIFQELGWAHSPGHPFLRPALQAVAPIFGIKTQMMVGSSLSPSHVPLTIKRSVRPLISAQNFRLNRGRVAKTPLTVIHMNRQNEALRHTAPTGHRFVMKSSASHLNRLRRAWN